MVNNSIGKILVVDDEVELKNALVEALTSQGFEAAGFVSAQDALEVLRGEAFDVLLTDLMMPEMDGITLVRESLVIDPHIVCMVMTGQSTIQTAVDAMKEGAFDYVLKPFRMQTVFLGVMRAMSMRHMRLENLHLRDTVAIYELAQTIACTLDPQAVINNLADAALQQTDADEVSVLLPTADGSELYVAAVRGENHQRLLGERVPLEEGISSWVMQERTPLILDGEINDERFRALWPRAEIRSAISVPMQVANKLVGTININALKRARPFTPGQMKALTILASTAAAALESASLYTEVEKAKENYRSIFENAVEGVFRATEDGKRFISVNPAMAKMFAYDDPDEMVNAVVDVTEQLGVNPERHTEAMRSLLEHGELKNFEARVRRKDGTELWTASNLRAVFGGEGQLSFFDGTVQDITERKRADEQLQESEKRFRELAENINEVFWIADPNRRQILYLSPAYEQLWGRTRASLSEWPESFIEAVHAEDKSQILEAAERQTRGESAANEYRIQRPDGSIRWIHDRAFPIKDSSGNVSRIVGIAEDITERKHAEVALRESEERYRDLVENAQDIIYSHDLQGNYTASNKATETITGYTREESLKLNFAQLIAPEYCDQVREMMARKLGGEEITAYELAIMAKDGRQIPIEVNSRLMLRDGVPIGVTGVARDITERKRVEAELRFQKSLLESQTEASLDGVLVVSPSRAILSFNRRFLELWGITQEMLGPRSNGGSLQAIADQVASPDEFVARVNHLYEHPDESSREEIELKDGRTLERHSAPVRGHHGEHYGRVWFFRDITERRLAQAELVRLAAAVEQTADSIVITDTEGHIEYVNPAFERITGYAKDEVLGENPRLLNSGRTEPAIYRNLWQTITRGDVWIGQLVNKKKNGMLFNERATISAVLDTTGKIAHFIAVKKDTTHETQLEEQLRQSQKLEAIGQLAGGVAHDFNNLLTVIGGYSSILLHRLDHASPLRGSVEEIKKASDRAAGLTRQLLAFSRKQILQPKILDLNVVVSDLDKMVRRLIGEDIDLLTITDPNLGKVKADPGQIEQVLLNLIVNARDAMPSGGKLTIETANVVLSDDYALSHAAAGGPYVMLAVTDTGGGMDAELQKHVFEPFFTTKSDGKGTGLGLATVYGIVKQSDGHVWLYSELGKGTSFKIYLPCADAIVANQVDAAGLPLVPKGTETILLVEDEDQVRRIVQSILEQQGYDVLAAPNGEEALKLAKRRGSKIHMLMTDVVMPQMSGRQLAEELMIIRPKMKVLYMSGYTDDAIVRHGLLDASLSFIQKPFDAATVARKVREVLDSTAPEVPGGSSAEVVVSGFAE